MKRFISILFVSVLILLQGPFTSVQEQSMQGKVQQKHVTCCNTDTKLTAELHSSLLQGNFVKFGGEDQTQKAAIEKLRYSHPLPSTGKVKTLILPIEFSDNKLTDCEEDFNNLPHQLFDPYDPDKKISEQSARGFYYYQSYGKLDITGDILDVYSAPKEVYFYSDNLDNWSFLVKEALDYNVAQGLDLNEYDSNGDGILNCLMVYLRWSGQSELGKNALCRRYPDSEPAICRRHE